MKPVNVVVAQSDAKSAEALASSLLDRVRSVSLARSAEELRSAIPRKRADVVIVDLELVGLPGLQTLCHDFEGTRIVCTHRLADEEMWTAALEAGALDCFHPADVNGIVRVALAERTAARSNAA